MSETAVKKVKKEEPDDEIQIVHINLRVPIVIPPETPAHDSPTPIPRPQQQQEATSAAATAATAATVSATPRLLPDPLSTKAGKDYWKGKRLSDKCPRCSEVVPMNKTARIEHYKINCRLMTPLARWMATNLGPSLGDRVCLICVRVSGTSTLYDREMLVKHIERTHPLAFPELLHRFHQQRAIDFDASMGLQPSVTATREAADVMAFPTCTIAGNGPSPMPVTTAADAAVAAVPTSTTAADAAALLESTSPEAAATASPTTLELDAPPSPLDEDYWRSSSAAELGPVSCPRCSYNAASGTGSRKNHYKRYHYNIYYRQTRSNRTGTLLSQWMAIHFGDVLKEAPRVCVHCEGNERFNSDYRNRADLIRHIQQAHPLAMIDLSRDYTAVSSDAPIADDEIHGLLVHALDHEEAFGQSLPNYDPSLKSMDDELTQTVMSAGNISSPMPLTSAAAAATAAMAPTSLALDAPPSPLDKEYWSGGTAFPSCPRCVFDSADSITARMKHYKRNHYDIYYELAPGSPVLTPFLKWMATHFGNVLRDMRSCVLCKGERRYWLGYRSRADLIRHMFQCHTVALINMAREYSVVSKGCLIGDDEVHELLMNALSEGDRESYD